MADRLWRARYPKLASQFGSELGHLQQRRQFRQATIFGQQAAMALTHAHLYATVKRQLYELSTLLAISTTLRQATGQEKVVEGLLSQAVGTLSVAGGAVHLIDRERDEVEAVRAMGVMASQQKQRVPLAGSLTAHVVEQRRPYFSNGHAENEPSAGNDGPH